MTKKTQPHIPIYRRIADEYKESITLLRYKPGDRVDSIVELQKRHSVSRETAKQVLKQLVDDGLIVSQAGKGSFIADFRARRKIWGIILPFFSTFYEEIVDRLREQAVGAGRQLELFVSYNNWEEEIRRVGELVNDRYEAIIVVPTLDESKTAPFYRRLTARNTVVVLLDHTMTRSFFSYVIQSYDLGVSRALEFLMDSTRGSIAFVHSETWSGRNFVLEMMEETYKQSLEAKRPSRQPVVVDSVKKIDIQWLQSNDITGIFCCDDTIAVRVIGRLKDAGISVPGDVRVVSYGNTDVARYFTPAITSVDCHIEEMVAKTTEIIITGLKGEDIKLDQFVIQPDLLIRET